MSEPKLISPMLDDFEIGGSISDHDGVRCCPAMRKNSDEKYIVKIISVPASQTKLDALLLTGAYPDKDAALAYFKDVADGIVDEKKTLDNLAQLEGFVSFDDCQIVPMDDGTGYEVYLLSEYRLTLERQNAKEPMTQLAAVNLALDMCAAMSACRRSGYMCVDLKPSNIYIVADTEYKIGDLGFVRLNSLKYESLPDKYRSCYTAPELEDTFAYLNDTMDIYSMGLILYQVFNGGVLPFSGNQAPCEAFASPAYADEEMSQIILKACAPAPEDRWQDPVQMGQEIVNYMQKNGVNDTPLTSDFFGEQETPSEDPKTFVEEESTTEDTSADVLSADIPVILPEEAEETVGAEETEEIEETETCDCDANITDEDMQSELSSDVEQDIQIPVEDCEDLAEPEIETILVADPQQETSIKETESIPQDVEYDNLSFLDDLDDAETILADMSDDYEVVTEDVSDILNQVDMLAAHQIPDPVVAPEPIEIKIPEPIVPEELAEEEEPSEQTEPAEEDPSNDLAAVEEDIISEEEQPYVPKKKRTGLIWGIVLAILVAIAAGAYFFYTLYYLQPIHSLELDGSEDRLQVQLQSDIDETILTVVCADSHGHKVVAPVVGGTAAFSGLTPDTAYTITVEVDGFHKLTGVTTKVYSTPIQTNIVQLNVVTGSEDGSVILNFTVDGPDSEQWNVIYNAEGEAERVTAFPSHMVTLTGLTVGKEYTFRLEPVDDIYISGQTECTYLVSDVLCAQDLHIASFMDGALTAQWDAADEEMIAQWTVRCYSEAGFDETIVTDENKVTFENIDESVAYTVEVTAQNMSVSQRVAIGANAVTVTNFQVQSTDNGLLDLHWDANREIPSEGWTVQYSVNGINASQAVTTHENAAKIPVIPGGNYNFTILDGSGNAVLGGPFTFEQSAAVDFDSFGITKDDMTIRLCKTPSASGWSYKDLRDEDYVNSFVSGESISMVFALSGDSDNANDSVAISFAIYDDENQMVSFGHDSLNWQAMWYENYFEMDVPVVPKNVGTYNVLVYFNGMIAGSQKFEITT